MRHPIERTFCAGPRRPPRQTGAVAAVDAVDRENLMRGVIDVVCQQQEDVIPLLPPLEGFEFWYVLSLAAEEVEEVAAEAGESRAQFMLSLCRL